MDRVIVVSIGAEAWDTHARELNPKAESYTLKYDHSEGQWLIHVEWNRSCDNCKYGDVFDNGEPCGRCDEDHSEWIPARADTDCQWG